RWSGALLGARRRFAARVRFLRVGSLRFLRILRLALRLAAVARALLLRPVVRRVEARSLEMHCHRVEDALDLGSAFGADLERVVDHPLGHLEVVAVGAFVLVGGHRIQLGSIAGAYTVPAWSRPLPKRAPKRSRWTRSSPSASAAASSSPPRRSTAGSAPPTTTVTTVYCCATTSRASGGGRCCRSTRRSSRSTRRFCSIRRCGRPPVTSPGSATPWSTARPVGSASAPTTWRTSPARRSPPSTPAG